MTTLIQNILQPAITRVGTIAASFLVAHGLDAGTGVTVETAITALGLFGIDLAVRAFLNRGKR
jgi:hypothetical protein